MRSVGGAVGFPAREGSRNKRKRRRGTLKGSFLAREWLILNGWPQPPRNFVTTRRLRANFLPSSFYHLPVPWFLSDRFHAARPQRSAAGAFTLFALSRRKASDSEKELSRNGNHRGREFFHSPVRRGSDEIKRAVQPAPRLLAN